MYASKWGKVRKPAKVLMGISEPMLNQADAC